MAFMSAADVCGIVRGVRCIGCFAASGLPLQLVDVRYVKVLVHTQKHVPWYI
jgi:hypothetical protein